MVEVMDSIEAKVAELNARYRSASPQEVLKAALEAFPGKIALVSSFGAESAVLLHMAAQIDKTVPVLFIETGMLFGQTLDYRKSLTETLGLTDVRDIRPDPAQLAANDPKNDLHKTSTDACCDLRKVQPLDTVTRDLDAWITGRKRFQSATRANLAVFELTAEGQVKVNPLANWGKAELDAYAKQHDLPAHPLVAFGYPSIGCWPCTNPVEEGQDARSGRWAGSEKTECGIHVSRRAS
jgi:phosphoadenosine phosphosulfate reductase